MPDPLAPYRNDIGRPLQELDTPVLCLDLDLLERNIARAAELFRQHGKQWRPHTKGYKTPELARRVLGAGAVGLTCAKLAEAEALAHCGLTGGLLVANQVVGPQKMARLARLAQRAEVIVTIDHADHVAMLQQAAREHGATFSVLIELDIGMRRAGVASPQAALALAQRVARTPGVQLAGIMGYEGHLLDLPDQDEKRRRIFQALDILGEARELLQNKGIPCPIVSAGGSGSLPVTITHPAVTELQAGGLVMMDAYYTRKCHLEGFAHALTIRTTITSRPAADRAVIDAGLKTQHVAFAEPLFLDAPPVVHFDTPSAEHATLRLEGEAQGLPIGHRLTMVPGYSDLTNVLHNLFHVHRQGVVQELWPLESRGHLR